MTTRPLPYLALACALLACEDPKLDPPGGNSPGLFDQPVPTNDSTDTDNAAPATRPGQWDGPPVELDPLPLVWGGLGILGLGGDDCISWIALGGEQVECDGCTLAFEVQMWGLDNTCGDISEEIGGIQLEVRDDILWADSWELGNATYGGGYLYFSGEEPWTTPYGYYGYLWY